MATIRLQEATDRIHAWLSSRGRSDNTIKGYVSDIAMFFQEMDLEEVEIDNLNFMAVTWMNQRRRIVAPKTLTRRITSMRALGRCLGVAMLEEYSAPTPASSMPHPLPGLAADIEKMLAVALSDRQRTLVALLALCGLRISEARQVAPTDFDLHNMLLTVRGKGDKTRIVPVSQQAWSVMSPCVVEATLSKWPTVILYTDRHARELITKLGARAKLARPISSHDLRATFGTLAYALTGNIRAVQELLGHASVEQTVLYTGVRLAEMRAAANFAVKVSQ